MVKSFEGNSPDQSRLYGVDSSRGDGLSQNYRPYLRLVLEEDDEMQIGRLSRSSKGLHTIRAIIFMVITTPPMEDITVPAAQRNCRVWIARVRGGQKRKDA